MKDGTRQTLNVGEIKINTLRKICSLMLLTIFFLLSSLSPILASPLEDKKREALDLKDQVAEVDSRLGKSVQEYENAYVQLTETNMAIQENLIKLDEVNRALSKCKSILNTRVDSIYRRGDIAFISVILGAQDFENFLSRLDYIKKICEEDARTLENIEELRKEAKKHHRELAESKARQRVVLNKIAAEKGNLERALEEKKELLSSVTAEVKTLEEQERRRIEEERRKAIENANKGRGNDVGTDKDALSFVPDSSFTFPVAQPYSYCDTWLAPRVGHLHQGCDIFALRGTPALACIDGKILRLSTGNLGGIGITLQDSRGNTYYYGHLDGYAPGVYEGMPAAAGQTIGFVGDTGNAKGTPPHVHFEIHPGACPAINPTPILRLIG